MDYLVYKSYLAHHGVEGQKWGVRRFQNADGSLTAEGRIHYGIGDADISNIKKSISGNYKKNGKVKSAFADRMLTKKKQFINSNSNKIDLENERGIYLDDNDKDGYDYYRQKFYKRWDKENKNRSDEDIAADFGDIEGLINDGYGDNAREVAREWEWTHGVPDEWMEWADYRDSERSTKGGSNSNAAINDAAAERAKAEIRKVADEIYGSDKMLERAAKGEKIADYTLIAIGGSLVTVGVGMGIANKIDANKHGGKGFLDRWGEEPKPNRR